MIPRAAITPQTLHVELLEEIFSWLPQRESVWRMAPVHPSFLACAQVCQRWLAPARRVGFRTIQISLMRYGPNNSSEQLTRFMDVIDHRDGHLAPYVRNVVWVLPNGSDGLDQYFPGQILERFLLLVKNHDLRLFWVSTSLNSQMLACALAILDQFPELAPYVRRVSWELKCRDAEHGAVLLAATPLLAELYRRVGDLDFCEIKARWLTVPDTSCSRIWTSNSPLTSLDFSYSIFATPSSFCRLLSHLPNLRKIRVYRCQFQSDNIDHDEEIKIQACAEAPPLESMEISEVGSQPAATALTYWLSLQAHDHVAVTRLRVFGLTTLMVQVFSSRLRTLDLVLTETGSSDLSSFASLQSLNITAQKACSITHAATTLDTVQNANLTDVTVTLTPWTWDSLTIDIKLCTVLRHALFRPIFARVSRASIEVSEEQDADRHHGVLHSRALLRTFVWLVSDAMRTGGSCS